METNYKFNGVERRELVKKRVNKLIKQLELDITMAKVTAVKEDVYYKIHFSAVAGKNYISCSSESKDLARSLEVLSQKLKNRMCREGYSGFDYQMKDLNFI